MFSITNEIKKAVSGDAWHGNHVMQTLNNVKSENAFDHLIPNAHSIAEIALHLTSWTEEVTSRLIGKPAAEPEIGDWPIVGEKTAQAWEKIIFNFKVANEELIRQCETIEDDQWSEFIKDKQSLVTITHLTKIELLNGLIQHHAYHSGQIAILSKY